MTPDPFLSPIAAGGILGALVIILGLLCWWLLRSWIAGLHTQLSEQKATSTDLVSRVRALEQALVNEVRTNGHDLKALVNDILNERREDRRVMAALISNMQEQTEFLRTRTCFADHGPKSHEPQSLPRVDTDVITAKNRGHG